MIDDASNKITHSIPLGALVEISEGPNAGLRLWVTEQYESPNPPVMYSLGALYTLDENYEAGGELSGSRILLVPEGLLRVIHVPDEILDEAINHNQTEAC